MLLKLIERLLLKDWSKLKDLKVRISTKDPTVLPKDSEKGQTKLIN